MVPLEQAMAGEQTHATQAILWGAVLLLAVLAMGVFVLFMRRRMLSRSKAEALEAFSIADLRAMRASGQLSDEEFKQLRAVVLGLAPPAEPMGATSEESTPRAATSEESAENDGNCPLSEAGPPDDS